MSTTTRTEVTHYHVQKRRRAQFLEDWRANHRTVVRHEDVALADTARGMRTGCTWARTATTRPAPWTPWSRDGARDLDHGAPAQLGRHGLRRRRVGLDRVDGERVEWGPGDSLHLPAWAWHRSGNDGEVTTRYMTFSSEPLLATMGMSVLEDAGRAA